MYVPHVYLLRTLSEGLQRVRFGYLGKDSNFSLRFADGQNEAILYPGSYPCIIIDASTFFYTE